MITQRIHSTMQASFAFLFNLVARTSRLLVLPGIMYWCAVSLLHIPVISWWPLTWAFLQSTTLDIHLVLLLALAYSYARSGERTSLIVTVVVLLGVIVSSLISLLGLTEPIFTVIRLLTLMSLSFLDLDRVHGGQVFPYVSVEQGSLMSDGSEFSETHS